MNNMNKFTNECGNKGKYKVVCFNCGEEFSVSRNEIFSDELGTYTVCKFCGSSFDVDDSLYDLNFKIFIYRNENVDSFVTEKAFNNVDEIKDMLNDYEGYWCRIIRTKDLSVILDGAFDDSFLDESYYVFK